MSQLLQRQRPSCIPHPRLNCPGFIVPGNPHDDVQLQFDLSLIEAARALVGLAALEGLAPAARAALEALGLAGAPGSSAAVAVRRARAGGQGPCDARLLAGLRAVSAQPAELEGLTLRALGDWASPLSLVSEVGGGPLWPDDEFWWLAQGRHGTRLVLKFKLIDLTASRIVF